MRPYLILIAVVLSALFLNACEGEDPIPPTLSMCVKSVDCATPPDDRDWICDEGGPSAITSYSTSGTTFDYQVMGTVPTPGVEYELIYAPDPWALTQTDLICLGTGTSDGEGNIDMGGSTFIGHDLPIEGDTNDGAKIWLVRKSLVDCEATENKLSWNCNEVLFENEQITYTYTGAGS